MKYECSKWRHPLGVFRRRFAIKFYFKIDQQLKVAELINRYMSVVARGYLSFYLFLDFLTHGILFPIQLDKFVHR